MSVAGVLRSSINRLSGLRGRCLTALYRPRQLAPSTPASFSAKRFRDVHLYYDYWNTLAVFRRGGSRSDRGLIAELSVQRRDWHYLDAAQNPLLQSGGSVLIQPPDTLDGESLSLCCLWGDNYYHWLFDALPRLKLLQDATDDRILSRLNHILVPGYALRFKQDSLALLGAQVHQLKYTRGCFLRCQDLWATVYPIAPHGWDAYNPNFPETALPAWVVEFLNTLTRHPEVDAAAARLGDISKKVVLVRPLTRGRQLHGGDDLLLKLIANGYTLLDPGNYSFVQQLAIFRDCTHIVAPHGAALANIAFCRQEAKVIEIFNPTYYTHLYARIAKICGLAHHPWKAWSSQEIANAGHISDIILSPQDCQSILELALRQ